MRAPHLVIDSWLGQDRADTQLAALLASDSKVAASRVSVPEGAAVDAAVRRSASFALPEETELVLREAVIHECSDWLAHLGLPAFEPVELEFDGVVHRDGDFFARHVDLSTDRMRGRSDRVVTAIYYLHRLPRAFAGGELTLHPVGGEQVAIDPIHDRLVLFPSFIEHEVRPVSVPGNAFADARFSINCWLRRPRS